MMDRPIYDTVEGIRDYLRNIADLRSLRRHRAEAYKRGEQLDQFVVLGRFGLDNCGNFGPCKIRIDGASEDLDPKVLPAVIKMKDLSSVISVTITTSAGHRHDFLPGPEDRCAECGRGWSIENIGDFKARESGKYHVYCSEIAVEREELKYLAEIASRAGLDGRVVIPVKNEYDRTAQNPWVRVRTHAGDIVFGWRRSVINIDYSGIVERMVAEIDPRADDSWKTRPAMRAAMSAETLFPEENVTRGDAHIHAHSAEKAVEYLNTVARKCGLTTKIYTKEK